MTKTPSLAVTTPEEDYPDLSYFAIEDGYVGAASAQLAAEDATKALAELAELRRWKAEATVVIERWDALWDYLGRPGALGEFRQTGVLREIDRLRADQVAPADRAIADEAERYVAGIVAWSGAADVEGHPNIAPLVAAVRARRGAAAAGGGS